MSSLIVRQLYHFTTDFDRTLFVDILNILSELKAADIHDSSLKCSTCWWKVVQRL